MLYSDLYFKPQSKPSSILIGVALLAVVAFMVSFFKLPSQSARASKQTVAVHSLVNVSPQEVGVFWQTDQKSIGWVVWGTQENKLDNISLDERDLQDKRTASLFHYVRIPNLTENTTYFYKLVSNNELVSFTNGKSFRFETVKVPPSSGSSDPAYGKIILSNGEPAVNAIVLIKYDGAYPILTLSKLDGAWLAPLPYMVESQTQKILTINKNQLATIEIYLDGYPKTTVTAPFSKITPLANTIIIGQDYKIDQSNVLPAATVEAKIVQKNTSIDVLFPKENAVIPASSPLIKGTALPQKQVVIKITAVSYQKNFSTFNSQTIANNKGEWTVGGLSYLPAGDYTLSITTLDSSNVKVTIRRHFSIAKSGESVLAAATAPATITPTAIPTPIVTQAVLTPTPAPTIPVATATPAPPVTGANPSLLIGSSILFILAGGALMLIF